MLWMAKYHVEVMVSHRRDTLIFKGINNFQNSKFKMDEFAKFQREYFIADTFYCVKKSPEMK